MSEDGADKLVKEANKQLGVSRGFGAKFLSSKLGNPDKACELFTKAGNQYKICGLWQKAGDAFASCAKVQSRCNDTSHEAAHSYVNAANCYVKTDATEAAKCYSKAGHIYIDMGRMTMAARQLLAAADVFETRAYDLDKALDLLITAERLYDGENQPATAGKCTIKIANIYMQQGKYESAKGLWEKLGNRALDNRLLIWGAKDHFFKAVLCASVIDPIHGGVALKQYTSDHPALQDSREYKLMQGILKAMNDDSVETFKQAQNEYFKVSRGDPWLLKVLDILIKSIPSYSPEDASHASTAVSRKPEYLPSNSRYRSSNFESSNPFGDPEESGFDSTNPFGSDYRNVADEDLDLT